MEQTQHRPRAAVSLWLVAGGCALVAGALALLATRHGIIVEQDSASYLSAARNLAHGHGYQDFTGTALTNFPPLFPAVIRVGMWVVGSATDAARLVNALAFAGSVVLAFVLLSRHVRSRAILVGATVVVACSIGLLRVADKALSEPMFWLFVIGFFLILERALERPDRRGTILCASAGFVVGLAFLTRYAGTVLIGVGIVAVVYCGWRSQARGIWLRLGAFLAAAAVLPTVWLVRNASTDAPHLLGPRVGSGSGPLELVRKSADGVGSLFLPQRFASLNGVLFWVLACAAGVAIVVQRRLRADVPGVATKSPLVPFAAFVVLYVPFIAWTNGTSGTSTDFRMFSPLAVPLVVLAASFLDDVTTWAERTKHEGLKVAVLAGGFAVVTVMALGTFYDAWSVSREAHGYTSPRYTQAPLSLRVRALPPSALVASNDPYRLYGAVARQPVVLSPGVEGAGISVSPVSLSVLSQHAACRGPVYLAWFGDQRGGSPELQKPEELKHSMALTAVAQPRDGTLYSMDVKPGAPAPRC